jgi:ATP-dependent DNA helicase RecG
LKTALEQYGHLIEDNLPQSVVSKYRLIGRKEALKQMHFPAGEEALHQAHRRLAYEEMLVFQLQMIWRRRQQQTQVKGIAHRFDEAAIEKFVEQLPFALTVSQRKVMTEILDDMKKPVMMNRLVQGDVGSGKTVIAAIALYAACLSGYQGAMMVPTEILAEQHEQTLKSLFARYPVEVARLTSGMPAGLKKQTHAQLQMGMVDVVVGTHALIQEEVTFRNIGLVITDEQHRFGVEQRGMLRAKGEFPDVLTMTATPIPRTLAITQFGDMEISVIDQLPEGRKPVKTYWVGTSRFNQVVAMLETTCRAGKQAYVICPLIEESDKLDLQDAVQLHQYLSEVLPDLHLGMLHGRMKNDEKEKLMRRFAGGEIAILVSTTVVEVGVNVPNATLMVIYNADRFGLSQLHQLRGRVGRGDDASVCVLVADPKTAAGRERMKLMTRTNNGFEIAEKDLQMRGPGDFFGVRQSGLPAFKVADLSRDYRIMVTAHRDAQLMLADPSFWQAVQYQWLRRQLTPNATVLD